MPQVTLMPEALSRAYDHLLQCRLVDITHAIKWNEQFKQWVFCCQADVPQPSVTELPLSVEFLVRVPEAFPRGVISFFPLHDKLRGFPHQDAETGKLCLFEDSTAPYDDTRLATYVRWMQSWLADAAANTLLAPGDPYELPDFSCKRLGAIPSTTVVFSEDSASFETWQPLIGRRGIVHFNPSRANHNHLFATSFADMSNRLIHRNRFGLSLIQQERTWTGAWLIVNDVRYFHHRPPQTFGELAALCRMNGLDLWSTIRELWHASGHAPYVIVLVGFPVSRHVGEAFCELHWQPIVINWRSDLQTASNKRTIGRRRKWQQTWDRERAKGMLAPSQLVPWGLAENVTHERLYSRGGWSPKLQNQHIVILGCGALGSVVAESLVRGGVKHLDLVDSDTLEWGNLCRHRLSGLYVGQSKAMALAAWLSTCAPLTQVCGHAAAVPRDCVIGSKVLDALRCADLILDCTADETTFEWLSGFAQQQKIRCASLFLDFGAHTLTMTYSDDSSLSCKAVFEHLMHEIASGQTPMQAGCYFQIPPKSDHVIEGAGCWHASFPAHSAHIERLALAAVECLNMHIDCDTYRSSGLMVMIQRSSISDGNPTKGIMDDIWVKRISSQTLI